jgi:putative DNA modification/repair radical SAM protein
MNAIEKINLLGEAAQHDLCGECGSASRVRDDIGRWIYPAALPDGRTVKLLKVLMSNACENDCFYCAQRRGRNFRRIAFRPDELARLFDELHHGGLVEALFLSSGIAGKPTCVMEQMLATVEILRRQYDYRGYVHLKILPGADVASIERAVQLANRVSINLEAPNQERLAAIAPDKRTQDLLATMKLAQRLFEQRGDRRATNVPRPSMGAGSSGQSTQFVVGAAGESDREILTMTESLYRDIGLSRVYFSAFQPVPDTPLDGRPPTPPLREHRLYQTDFLFRKYGFSLGELIFDAQGNLPRDADPKEMWAAAHPERFPIEVNRASKDELLRVPGIGPITAARIVKLRSKGKFRSLDDLTKVGIVSARAAPYVLLDGKRPPMQLSLW